MSTADRPDARTPAGRLAAACRSAGFVRLTATADGDALAALGQFGAALRSVGVPFQASVLDVPTAADVHGTDADATVLEFLEYATRAHALAVAATVLVGLVAWRAVLVSRYSRRIDSPTLRMELTGMGIGSVTAILLMYEPLAELRSR
jgi:hypothetical protein